MSDLSRSPLKTQYTSVEILALMTQGAMYAGFVFFGAVGFVIALWAFSFLLPEDPYAFNLLPEIAASSIKAV